MRALRVRVHSVTPAQRHAAGCVSNDLANQSISQRPPDPAPRHRHRELCAARAAAVSACTRTCARLQSPTPAKPYLQRGDTSWQTTRKQPPLQQSGAQVSQIPRACASQLGQSGRSACCVCAAQSSGAARAPAVVGATRMRASESGSAGAGRPVQQHRTRASPGCRLKTARMRQQHASANNASIDRRAAARLSGWQGMRTKPAAQNETRAATDRCRSLPRHEAAETHTCVGASQMMQRAAIAAAATRHARSAYSTPHNRNQPLHPPSIKRSTRSTAMHVAAAPQSPAHMSLPTRFRTRTRTMERRSPCSGAARNGSLRQRYLATLAAQCMGRAHALVLRLGCQPQQHRCRVCQWVRCSPLPS